jgi:hypothetical protein
MPSEGPNQLSPCQKDLQEVGELLPALTKLPSRG